MPTTSVFLNNDAVRFPVAGLLEDVTGVNYSGLKRQPLGLLYGSLEQMRDMPEPVVDKSDINTGKINKFIHYYQQRRLAAATVVGTPSITGLSNVPCQTPTSFTTYQRDAIETVSFTQNVTFSWNEYKLLNDVITATFNNQPVLASQLTQTDAFLRNQRRVIQEIRSAQNAIHTRIDSYLLTQVLANRGAGLPIGAPPVNYNVTTPAYPIINLADRKLDYVNGIGRFMADMRNSELYGRPNIIGMGIMAQYENALAVSGLQDTGTDLGLVRRAQEYNFYYDTVVGDLLGNDVLFIFPGSMVVTFANQFTGQFEQRIGNEIYTVVRDPVLSQFAGRDIYADLKIRHVTCSDGGGTSENNPQIMMILTYHFGVSFLPTDIYATGDRLLPFPTVPVTGIGRILPTAA